MTNKHGTDNIETTLAMRAKIHGPFETHAKIEDALLYVCTVHGKGLSITQASGMRMIMHKIARILNGGHTHKDTWHDIAGYATLVEKSMK